MKLDPSTNKSLKKVPPVLARESKSAASQPLPEPRPIQDEVKFDPLRAVFGELEELGYKSRADEASHIEESLSEGFEALVQLSKGEGKSEVVVPVRTRQDMRVYTGLLTGKAVPKNFQRANRKLREAEEEGHRFFLPRHEEHLATDFAGAGLSFQRGSRVLVKRLDGKFETFSSAEKAYAFLRNTNPTKVESGKTLQQAREAGLVLAPHQKNPSPEGEWSLKSAILSAFRAPDKMKLDSKLIQSLEQHGKVDVAFPDDKRPLPLPLSLSPEEIALASRWDEDPTARIKWFKKKFKSLEEDGTILMTEQATGDHKGMVVKADARSAFFQLKQEQRVVALDKDGDLHELTNLHHFQSLRNIGRVSQPNPEPFDGDAVDSDNLMMFYHVSPFDPLDKGNYDDLPQRITAIGSSKQLDIVTMRSDLPKKRNLRIDRVQKGELQSIDEGADASHAMSDPEVLEEFIYRTVSRNLGDEKIRLLVGGHGGAEKGLLPDGDHNNSAADEAMPVDDFAQAISKALDRVEEESGQRPKIHNLMLVSCLMGNTSFINALAKTGDVETLVASPELMAGTNPLSTFEYLADPKTSKASAREYAEFLVDDWSQAPAMIGGDKNQRHADTIGAYDLSPQKAKRFEKALNGFFEAALAEPQYASYLKEGISKAPSYGINPLVNVMFDVDNRDLLQVLDYSHRDARIRPGKLKKAIKELREATEAQVISQKVSADYEGRRGPSLYLPLDHWDYNEKMTQTSLLKESKYDDFIKLIFEAPLQRRVAGTLISEVSRVSETGSLDKAFEKIREAVSEDPLAADGGKVEALVSDVVDHLLGQEKSEKPGLRALEQPLHPPSKLEKAGSFLGKATRTAFSLATGAIVGTLGAVTGLVGGAVLGTKAGWTGYSAANTHVPASKEEMSVLSNVVDELIDANDDGNVEDPENIKAEELNLSPLKGLFKGRVAKGLWQLALWPAESTGISVHEKVGHKFGELPGKVAGAIAGGIGGAVASTFALGGASFAASGLIASSKLSEGAGKIADKLKKKFSKE